MIRSTTARALWLTRGATLFGGAVVTLALLLGVVTMAATPAVAKQVKVTVCHNGHEISVATPALKAHMAHGDEEGSCDEGEVGEEEGAACQPGLDPVEGAEVTDTSGSEIVQVGDILSIPGDFERPAANASITVKDAAGDEATFVNQENAGFALDGSGLHIWVIEPLTDQLETEGLVGVSSVGITCADTETAPATLKGKQVEAESDLKGKDKTLEAKSVTKTKGKK